MIDEKTGRRYERCTVCGSVWNVARHQAIPSDGYLCPTCGLRSKLRKDIKAEGKEV